MKSLILLYAEFFALYFTMAIILHEMLKKVNKIKNWGKEKAKVIVASIPNQSPFGGQNPFGGGHKGIFGEAA